MARKMKDSGIEWIGEIPEGWSVSKVLHCLSMPITDGPHTTPILYDTGIPFVSAEAVSCGNGRIDFSHIRGYISEKFYKECCQKYIPEIDDIYMIKSGATTGRVAIVDTTRVFTIWSPLAVFRCNKDCILPKFLFYYLQSPAFQKEVEFGWTFGTQQNVGMRSLEQMKVCVPPLNEQNTIVNHLDYQCAQIDLLLQKALSSIEEYKKLKQAVITQAVTKGVRGERAMKDSGVEWIGEIPAEWKIQRFAHVAEVKSNLVSPDNYLEYPQISPENIEKDSGKLLLPCRTVAEVGVISGNHLFYKGQILYSKIRPKLSKVCIAPFDGLCSADMYPIESKNDTRYIVYCILSNGFLQQVSMITENRVKMPKINQVELSKILVAIPETIAEQKEIADYLDAKCAEIDRLIAKKEQLVKELESYKKSLIYEVVTGKREV